MKNTHSSGLTSVPVAIMSTVTAMRSVGDWCGTPASWPLGVAGVVGDLGGEVVALAEHLAHLW